jgi:PhnB protein
MRNPQAVSPYLCCREAVQAIDFYVRAFGAVEHYRLVGPDGRVGHAELQLGPTLLMISSEHPEAGVLSPQTLGGSPVTIHLYVDDADASVARAVAAGATVERPVEEQFYGDRGGKLVDPFGHCWWVAHHTEQVSAAEIRKRFDALYADDDTVRTNP